MKKVLSNTYEYLLNIKSGGEDVPLEMEGDKDLELADN